jgi:high-affinity iron transporter
MMIPSFLLSLREGVEAALIIGIVLGTLRKINRMDMSRSVWFGAGSAAILSFIAALLLQALGATFEGQAEEIFEGTTMILAAGVLTWMVFWMQRQSLTLKSELESGVQQAALSGGYQALFSLAFLAVLREGIELALFLTAASITTEGTQILIGAALGLAAAAFLGWLLFATTVRLNLRHFFQATSILLILFAVGLFAHGVHEFNEAGLIPPVIVHVWDTNHILDEDSSAGVFLKALFGYNGNPSLTEVIAYGGFLAAIIIGLRIGPYKRVLETHQTTQ